MDERTRHDSPSRIRGGDKHGGFAKNPSMAVGTHSVGRRLIEFSAEIEKTFLAISARIKEFSSQTTEISRLSLATAGAMSGDEINGAISGIRGMVDSLRSLFQKTEAQTEERLGHLRKISNDLASVEDDLNALQDTATTLRMLGLSTKIQSTRTGQNMPIFMQLGEDIAKMSSVILDKGEELIGQSSRLSDLVGKTLHSGRTLRVRQVKQTSNVLMGARQVLDSLQDISRNSREESQRILLWTREIEGSIGQVTASAQDRDTVLQSLERIRGSLTGNEGGGTIPGTGSSGAPRAGIDAALRWRRDAANLRDTCGKMVMSVRNIIDGLSMIRVNVADMAQVTIKANGESIRFLGRLEKGMGSITAFLAEVVESDKEMSDSMNLVAQTVEGMSAFTHEIEMISSDVELISLNARIKAAQTGYQGAGMGVIAGAVHLAATESNACRKSFLDTLRSITLTAETLRQRAEESTHGEVSKLDVMVRELGVLLDALRIMQERIVSNLDLIEKKGMDLSDLITKTIQEVQFHVRAEEFIAEVARDMEAIATDAIEKVPVAELAALGKGQVREDIMSRATADEKLRMLERNLP